MNKMVAERLLVVVLFVVVMVLFSLANKDSKALKQLYTQTKNAFPEMASVKK